METTVYKTTLILAIIGSEDYAIGIDQEVYNKIFPTAEEAIEKAKQLFNEYQVSNTNEVNSISMVWAAVWPVVKNEQGSKTGDRIFNLYKDRYKKPYFKASSPVPAANTKTPAPSSTPSTEPAPTNNYQPANNPHQSKNFINPPIKNPHTMKLTERIAIIEGYIETLEDINNQLLSHRYVIMVDEKAGGFEEYFFDPLKDAICKMETAAELLRDATKALKAETR